MSNVLLDTDCLQVTHCRSNKRGFSLIELLVVIAIIAILIAITIPGLSRVREQANRIECGNKIHHFIIGAHLYAEDHDMKLPSGYSDVDTPQGNDEHAPILSRKIRNELIELIGDDYALRCSSLREPFTDPNGYMFEGEERYGYIIGYNYLGGHFATPWGTPQTDFRRRDPRRADNRWTDTSWVVERWTSPKFVTAAPGLPLVAELNTWTSGGEMTFAPHGSNGSIMESGDSRNKSVRGIPSKDIGAAGGNLGNLDGSVKWKSIDDMKVYKASRFHEERGCFAAW
jgi:prepilin-type N-terminal cleavage/methylation domain-containing protein